MENNLPLSGIKVVELSTVVAAPTTAEMFAAYGAEVIKIETAWGDEMRATSRQLHIPSDDINDPAFTVNNSNKILTSINIKSEKGIEALKKLIANADVFITNVRNQSLAKVGLDYESLKDEFPKLIYAHFSGYGPKGPNATDPGFDVTSFWLKGGMAADFVPVDAPPLEASYAFGDMATSSAFFGGIMTALFAREKTGKGTLIETSLYAAAIWYNSFGMVEAQFEKQILSPVPGEVTDPLFANYICSDGRMLMVSENLYVRDMPKYCRVLGLDYLIDDPRTQDLKVLNKSGFNREMYRLFAEVFATKTAEEWRAIMAENSIACEIYRRSYEIAKDPQAIENKYVEELEFPDGRKVMMPCPPIHFSEYERRPYVPAGPIGQHTDEVMKGIGYTAEEIAAMKEAGDIK